MDMETLSIQNLPVWSPGVRITVAQAQEMAGK